MLKGLEYRGELVGLRLITGDTTAWDISKEVLKEWGITHFNIKEKIKLKPYNDLLLSESEAKTGVYAEDISNAPLIKEKAKELILGKYFELVRGFRLPWQMSLYEFMSDEGWVVQKVDRTDEHRNQHIIYLPDGSAWTGGWIGSFKSLDNAKAGFHANQVYYALHRGEDVSLVALDTYPALQEAYRLIGLIQSRIRASGETLTMEVNGEKKSFKFQDYVGLARYEERSFVKNEGLVDHDIQGIKDTSLTSVEMTCIAITRVANILKSL